MRPLVTASVVLVAPPGFLLEEWLSQLVAVLLTAIMAMLARSVANWRAVQAAAKAKRDHFWVLRAERDCAVNRVGVRRPPCQHHYHSSHTLLRCHEDPTDAV